MGPVFLLPLFLACYMSTPAVGEPSYYNYQNAEGYYYPKYTYKSYSYPAASSDNKVYVTDRYGRTSVKYGSGYAYSYPYNPFARYVYKYTTYPDDNVYVTDMYGRTNVQCGSCRYNYGRAMSGISICSSGTCGQYAHCSVVGDRPVCSCLRGYSGDPLTYCKRSECIDNSECRGHQTCINEKCVDPCEGTCGVNAQCQTRNHVPVCSCPPGHTGNPFTQCRRFDPEELCHPSPCGQNTQCEVVNGVPTCKCLPGYHGSPLQGCRHECESDTECGPSLACIEFRCQNPCTQCGTNAECERVLNHRPVCKCPRGYYGNPALSCRPECESDSECPAGKPACIYNSCKNPCDGVCGVGANCELRGLTPVCSCPKDMTGDPFTRCRPFEARDLCEPNPCGANARCEPGFDKYNKERPVCICLPGYTGNGVQGCVRGECTDDTQCPDNKACLDYKCQNPCIGQCGVNAECNPRRHLAVCTCPPGYHGDALTQCTLSPTYRAGRLNYCRTC